MVRIVTITQKELLRSRCSCELLSPAQQMLARFCTSLKSQLKMPDVWSVLFSAWPNSTMVGSSRLPTWSSSSAVRHKGGCGETCQSSCIAGEHVTGHGVWFDSRPKKGGSRKRKRDQSSSDTQNVRRQRVDPRAMQKQNLEVGFIVVMVPAHWRCGLVCRVP